jgi:hypothetical protein
MRFTPLRAHGSLGTRAHWAHGTLVRTQHACGIVVGPMLTQCSTLAQVVLAWLRASNIPATYSTRVEKGVEVVHTFNWPPYAVM